MTIVREEGDYRSDYYKHQEVEHQSPPYVKPLRYRAYGCNRHYDAVPYKPDIWLANGFLWDQGVSSASNNALDKLYDQLGQAESLRVAWLEREKSLSMVTGRLRALISIARAVKRRDPRIVRRVLKRKPAAKDIIKVPAGLWLEYWFGWAPLVSDLHHALGIFGAEFPSQPLRATGRHPSLRKRGGREYDWYEDWSFDTRVKLGGEIYAIDPNVTLASSLGFGQPLSVAWEATPFSWVVDYFANVGSLLKNLEPRFPGIKTRNEYTTVFITCDGQAGYRNSEPLSETKLESASSWYMSRSGGWPSYQLEFSSPLNLSGQRCSYLASVLSQLLTSMKKK